MYDYQSGKLTQTSVSSVFIGFDYVGMKEPIIGQEWIQISSSPHFLEYHYEL